MARISTYVIDGTIVDGDKVIGSDANNSMQTKNYTVGDLVNYFAASIGNDFLVPYIGANDDVNLGTFNLSAGGLSISQEIIANGTAGISGQILMSQGIGNPAVWGYPIGTQDLNSVLNIGNVGNKNIYLTNANGSALIDVEKTYSKIAFYLVDTISGSQSAWDTNNLHVENSSYLADYSSNKIRYTTGLYYVDIIPTNYSNQTFMLPYNGGYIPMSVNGVYADASGSITIPIGVGSVTNVTATAPLSSTGGVTPDISIPQANASADGYLSSTDWNTFDGKQDPITLTTTGTSGAATFVANTLNIPQYSGGQNLQQVTDIGNSTDKGINLAGEVSNPISGVTLVGVDNGFGILGLTNSVGFNLTPLTASRSYDMPDANNLGSDAVLALSVNGNFADNAGNITISGGSQNLQQVTDAGNTTTNDIYVGNNITVGVGPYISVVPLYNTVLGVETLLSNDDGDGNVAIGFNALKSNVNGSYNVAVGRLAMFANIDGDSNCAFGDAALTSNTSGYANSAFGPYALVANTTGTSNIGFGTQALGSNTMGDQNVGIGRLAGYYNISGSQNIFIGYNAGINMELGDGNTIIGANRTSNSNNSGYVIIGSSTNTRIEFNDLGQGKFPSYGVGSYTTGTVTYVLGVDASGNIIETTAGGTTPDLQQVTDAGNETTNDVYVKSINVNDIAAGGGFYWGLNANDNFNIYDPQNVLRLSIDGILGGINLWDPVTFFVGTIETTNLTAQRSVFFPDASGTLALSVNGNFADVAGNITISGGSQNLQQVTDIGNITTNDIEIAVLQTNGDAFIGKVGAGAHLVIDDGIGNYATIDATNLTTPKDLHLPDATGTFALSVNGIAAGIDGDIIAAIPTKTSELINDGDNGYTHFISLQDLPSNLTLYATNVASGISTYTKAVSSLTDPDFNTVAVDIPVGPLTSTTVATYCGGIISAANIIVGNPGIFTMSTIGNIRRTSGTAEGVFFYEVYKRDSGGTETLIVTSANTFPVSSPTYVEFNAAALFNNGVFTATDRIVIKFYGLRLPGGSNPSFDFQFGGIAPVRTTLPIPLAVTPLPREIISISTNTAAGYSNGVDYIYLVSGATTLTLPTAVGNVGEYTVKRVGAGVVSIATTSSQTIDGSASPITINVQYVSLTLVSDGANWNII